MKSKKSDFNFKELSELPAVEREEVRRWIVRLSAVQKPIQKSLSQIARHLGCSVGTVRKKYDLWQRYEDWRDLVNFARLPKSNDDRIVFIEWWQALCVVHARKCASAHRDFVRRFHSGEFIPGISLEISRDKLPEGCGYASLIRLAPPQFNPTTVKISTRKKPYQDGLSRKA